MTTIYIDADACPVKEETVAVARRHRAGVKIVCNGGIRPLRDPLVEMVYVAEGPDAAMTGSPNASAPATCASRPTSHWPRAA